MIFLGLSFSLTVNLSVRVLRAFVPIFFFCPSTSSDPFAEANDALGGGGSGYVHIRTQQRTARKKLTTCEGLPQNINFNKILRALRKNFNCNGNMVEHTELGKVIQLQGDHRDSLVRFLTETGICQPDHIKVHGAQ